MVVILVITIFNIILLWSCTSFFKYLFMLTYLTNIGYAVYEKQIIKIIID